MKVLWVDDDAPSEPADIGNTSVLTAGNCPDAVELIDQLASVLDAIVVDLILPQHGWGSSLLTYPGLELVRYIVQAFSDELPVAVYTVVDGDDILAQASEQAHGGCSASGLMRSPTCLTPWSIRVQVPSAYIKESVAG